MPTTIKNRIKEMRELRGYSMATLAARMNPPTTAPQIDKLEKGRVNLTLDWMYRLADALDCKLGDLFEEREAAAPPPQEKAVLDLYRGLSEQDREAVFRVVDAMAKSHGSDSAPGKKANGNGG